jgi:hypothetical protein
LQPDYIRDRKTRVREKVGGTEEADGGCPYCLSNIPINATVCALPVTDLA